MEKHMTMIEENEIEINEERIEAEELSEENLDEVNGGIVPPLAVYIAAGIAVYGIGRRIFGKKN
ncbi:MAG: class IIb bacteriocin, lactobin A/cerein 7B family [Clostridia bacterium]|nr:class IIb bacteriocin, lactobin A/cerein 7B family [Clostridia bacterium]